MPSAGTATIAIRDSMTDSKSGRSWSNRHGPGSVTSVPGTGIVRPRDSSTAPKATAASPRTRGSRHNHTTSTTVSAASGQPKKAFCSVRLRARASAVAGSPASERPANSSSARGELPDGPCSTLR